VNKITARIETSKQLFIWVRSTTSRTSLPTVARLDDIDHAEKALSIFKRVDGEDAPADGAYQIVIKKKIACTLIAPEGGAGSPHQ
jgi:hypothetical protein